METKRDLRIDANSVDLHVIDQGHGEPALVFLHYWGGSARTWDEVIQVLSSSSRCIAYDQRGWGTSGAPAFGYELSDLASDLTSVLTQLQIRCYILVGHSMGGKVAMLHAASQPAGLDALVLVAPASPFPQDIPEGAKEAQLHAYDNRETALRSADFLTWRKLDQAATEQVVEDSLRGSTGAKYAWPSSAAYEDIFVQVRRIAVPTLVVGVRPLPSGKVWR